MKKCNECIEFKSNPFNEDGLCKKINIKVAGKNDCCCDFKQKLDDKELCILEFSKKIYICIKEYEKFTGLEKQVFDELIENGCLTGKGMDKPTYCYIQTNEFKKNYPDLFN